MLKKTIIGFMLALFAGPLSAHAELPGQPCTAAQIGTTKMADDKQNIIACLETGKAAPENVQEWKAMTSSGPGGGITGGCLLTSVQRSAKPYAITIDKWGAGCQAIINGAGQAIIYVRKQRTACNSAAASGYSCGTIFVEEGGISSCTCVKE
ncbi:MAG: hypothetical protein IPI58_07215 [Alphaproteobacteria bacterium]|nr:MAG: hypothetical protein IPI58_07215 [Alphaproteobacteria bacterium]